MDQIHNCFENNTWHLLPQAKTTSIKHFCSFNILSTVILIITLCLSVIQLDHGDSAAVVATSIFNNSDTFLNRSLLNSPALLLRSLGGQLKTAIQCQNYYVFSLFRDYRNLTTCTSMFNNVKRMHPSKWLEIYSDNLIGILASEKSTIGQSWFLLTLTCITTTFYRFNRVNKFITSLNCIFD